MSTIYEEEGRLNIEKVLSSELGKAARSFRQIPGRASRWPPISWKYNERTVIHLGTEHLSTCVEKSFLHLRDPYFVKPSNTKKGQRVKYPDFEKRKKGKKDNPWRDSNPQPSHMATIHRSEKR
jgi:hypothetical protein